MTGTKTWASGDVTAYFPMHSNPDKTHFYLSNSVEYHNKFMTINDPTDTGNIVCEDIKGK